MGVVVVVAVVAGIAEEAIEGEGVRNGLGAEGGAGGTRVIFFSRGGTGGLDRGESGASCKGITGCDCVDCGGGGGCNRGAGGAGGVFG